MLSMKSRYTFRLVFAAWLAFLGMILLSLIVRPVTANYRARNTPQAPDAVLDTATNLGADQLLSVFRYDNWTPAIAYNNFAEEFLVVWNHDGHIYGQRYTVQGVPVGENFSICDYINGQAKPSVAYSLSADRYLVVWQDGRGITGDDIYGQFVDANGGLLGTAIGFDQRDLNQERPAVETDGNDFLVVWQSDEGGGIQAIYGRGITGTGTMSPDTLTIAEGGGETLRDAAVAYNATEAEYLVVYQYSEDENTEIRGRRVSSAGTLPGMEYTIADQSGARNPDLASSAVASWVVVWDDERGATSVYGQVVLAGTDNAFDGGDFLISSATDHAFDPAIARSPSTGQFLVVWCDGRMYDVNDWDLYGQRLQSDANLIDDSFAINAADDAQYAPAVAASQAPDVYFAAWEGRRGHSTIYGQRVAWTGSLLWYGFAISAQPDDQQSPAVVYNHSMDEYLAVWDDADGSIYGVNMSADGQALNLPRKLSSLGDNLHPQITCEDVGLCMVTWRDKDDDRIEYAFITPNLDVLVTFSIPDSAGGDFPQVVFDTNEEIYLLVWEQDGNIYARKIDLDGSIIAALDVCTEGHAQGYPDLVFNELNGRILVVWEDDRAANTRIYGRLMEGSSVAPEFLVAGANDAISRHNPAVAANPDIALGGEFLVAYTYRVGSKDDDIYGQRLNSQGEVVGSEIVIRDQPVGMDQFAPDVFFVADVDRYYIVWSEFQSGTSDHDLYCRWLETDGSLATGALPLFKYPENQWHPAVTYDPDHQQGLIVWEDYRRGTADVYARLGGLDSEAPVALFLRNPSTGAAGSTFTFDARPSHDNATPQGALAVRWDWTSDGAWDTMWSYEKVVTQTIMSPGVYTITLEVRDLMWYTDSIALPVQVLTDTGNVPPVAVLTASPESGVAGENFLLNASDSSDVETSPNDLLVRWDWENDGIFDTLWSGLKIRSRSFTTAGSHTVQVEVRDEDGLTAVATYDLLIFPGEVVSLTVTPENTALGVGGSIQFRATGWDTYGNEMNNLDVTWSVGDPKVGSIDDDGNFSAGFNAGTYADVVQVEYYGIRATASLTIICSQRLYLPMVLR